jgi:ribosomal protein S6--L-glutamate ligase
MFAPTPAAASAIAETLLANRVPVLLQGYIPTERTADIRAFVVDGTVVAAMGRFARPGEFRSNLHRGALAERHTPTATEAALAVAAAETLGLSIAGIDLLPTNNGPVILEVNSSPGLSGIEAVTKVDVARAMIESITGKPHRLSHETSMN